MGALTASIIAIAGIALGWITIEIACKPCLEKGREAIDRNLNPNYDPDDDDDGIGVVHNNSLRAPLKQDDGNEDASPSSTIVKIV